MERREPRERADWECVKPSSLEAKRSSTADDAERAAVDAESCEACARGRADGRDPVESHATGCPVGNVPTASPGMPLHKRAKLAVDAARKLFHYIGDLRRAR